MARFNWAFENPNFDFVGSRWIAFSVDGLLLIVALTSLWFQGLNLGIDFTGGVLMEVQSQKEIDDAQLLEIREKVTNLGFGHVEVQTLADTNGRQTEALIRVQPSEKLTNQEQIAAQKITATLGPTYKYLRTEAVGPKVSGELFNTGVFAAVLAVLMIAIYVAFRFEWQFGVSALLSNGHDVLMAVGLYSIARLDFNLTSIAALLTLAGYSINETVIIFDRIRENRRKYRKTPLGELINMSTNQTLARTVKTSTTVALALIPLAIWGGHTLFGFSVTILWGILSGTYSSVFVASSLLLYMPPLANTQPQKEARPRALKEAAMPDRKRVEDFIAVVVSGAHVKAIEDFYHDDASMQENLKEPRRGRALLMEHEANALKRVDMYTHPNPPFAVTGDTVAINWTFDATGKDGVTRRLNEVALQRWQGDRIIEERFFYDTASAWQVV